MKQLDRLLFEQGGDCFFCKQPLAKEDASVEHLLAQANGGTSAEENVVACCKAINSLLGNKPLKEKLAIILRQKNGFQCPAKAVATPASPAPTALLPISKTPSQLASPAVATAAPKPLVRRTATTAKPASAPPTISSAGIIALTRPPVAAASQVASVTSVVCPTCRRAVPSAVGQLDYVCPHCRGAFRY